MPTQVAGDVRLDPLEGEPRTLEEWTSSFHLVLVALDPFTDESSWILPTAAEILSHFAEADCRAAWLVTGTAENARQFLGPWAEELLTFVDPEYIVVRALGLDRLPAFVHLNAVHAVEAHADGWRTDEWQSVADGLALVMRWSAPNLARLGGPPTFEGTTTAP